MMVLGIAMIKEGPAMLSMVQEYAKNEASYYLGGCVALLIGLLIIISHNIWVGSWPILITLFGYMASVKGTLLLWFPHEAKQIMGKYADKLNFYIFGAVYFALGAFLSWKGFF